MSLLGHNRPPVEKKVPDLDFLLEDDPEKLFMYASWHIGDYITGTMGMTLEMEGAYQRFLMRLYQRGKPLPDDDRYMSMIMSLTTRVWKRVKGALIEAGKIMLRAGCLTNSRFEKERIKRAEQRRKQIEAGVKRWEKERAEKLGLAEVSAKFAPSLPEVSTKLSPTEPEKPNNNNETPVTDLMESRIQESNNHKKERSPIGDSASDQLALVPDAPPKLTASVAAKEAFGRYNDVARRVGIPVASKLTEARKRALALRVKEAGGLDKFDQALAHLERSAFLQGQNDRGWRADIDFICQPKSFHRLLEGGYGNGAHAPAKPVSKDESWFDRAFARRQHEIGDV